MVDTKSKDDKSKESGPRVAAKSSDDTKGIYEITEDNSSRLMDEIIKIQAEYSQALSNLQSDYIKTIKNIVSASFLAQKHLADNVRWWNETSLPNPSVKQFLIRQSDALAINTIRTLYTNNQLIVNVLEAVRDNLKTYYQMINSVTAVNINTL